jgi:DNA-binding transcriptional ArsR family regulator
LGFAAVPEIYDELFLSRIRLTIVAELLQAEWVAFTDLLGLTGATRGNLGSHLGKLIEAKIIDEEKRFVRQRPVTRYRLTKFGRDAFLRHIEQIEQLFKAARSEYGEAQQAPADVSATLPSPVRTEV